MADVLKPLGLSADYVMHDAAAQVFLDAHRKRPREEVVRHMHIVSRAAGGVELLLREAILGSMNDVGILAMDTVNRYLMENKTDPDEVFTCLAPELIAKACCLSFALYDKYVSYLLGIPENKKCAKLVDERLRHLVLCPGYVFIFFLTIYVEKLTGNNVL